MLLGTLIPMLAARRILPSKQPYQSKDNLSEDDAEADTEDYEQAYECLSAKIDTIAAVDYVIAPFLVLLKRIANILAVLFEHFIFLLGILVILNLQLCDTLVVQFVCEDHITTIKYSLNNGSHSIVGTLAGSGNGYNYFLQVINSRHKFVNDFLNFFHILCDLA